MRFFSDSEVSDQAEMDRRTVSYQGQPSGSQGNSVEPPVKEIRTYSRDGTTVTEEYERMNPDGTVTKTVSVGDLREGLKHFNVYKMDNSGIVRKVTNASPEEFFTGQAAVFGPPGGILANMKQAAAGTSLTPPPTMQQQLIALKDVVKDAPREIQAAAFDDYKDRLIRFGTKKLDKVLRKKLDNDFLKGEFSMTPEKTEQLMDYGVKKLHNLLNKTLDKEKFLSGDFRNETGNNIGAPAPPFSFTFHPLNSAGSGESKPTRPPLTFNIRPDVEPKASTSTSAQGKKDSVQGRLKTFWNEIVGGDSSNADASQSAKYKNREDTFDEEDYDDSVEMKRKELKKYLKQDAKKEYTSEELQDRAEVYEYAMKKVDSILNKVANRSGKESEEDSEYVQEEFKTLEKSIRKMMRDRDSDDVSPSRRQKREEFLKMAFKELRDSIKKVNPNEEKPKKKPQFSDLFNDEITELADKKMKKLMKPPQEEDGLDESDIENMFSKKSSSSRRKYRTRSDQSSDDDELKWTVRTERRPRASSPAAKEIKTPTFDFNSLLAKLKDSGVVEKQNKIENQTVKKVQKPTLDFDTFLSNIRNGLIQESNSKSAPETRQIPQARAQPRQAAESWQPERQSAPKTLDSLLEKIRQQSSNANYKPQTQQTNPSSPPQFNTRAYVNSGFEAPKQPEKKPTNLETLISNIYKMNNTPAIEPKQKGSHASPPPVQQTERKVHYSLRDEDDDDISFKIKVHPQNNVKAKQSSGGLGNKTLNVGNSINEAMPWWFAQEPKLEPKNESVGKIPFMEMPPNFTSSLAADPFAFFNQALGAFSNAGPPALTQ